ncbi:hypothetical protein RJ639_030524 [Escallonia herrerae]|uniref:Protein kinase domain-containing protein n=1 Tax=Escallonia herrerae TaxID=1293975 RepID=A0AA88X709_9ASTE|nr:hypothetical protein RJ639_030524 [Escallonia herrerae]
MLPLLLFILVLCNSNFLVGSLNDEGYALLSLKQSIREDPGGSLNNWNYSDENPCSWNGITCKQDKVVSVSIPKQKLSGFLPTALGALSELRHLNLRSNRFFGSLPVELFRAQGLQSVVLYGNSFSGSLPIEIGKLNYLQTLDLSQNFFNGSLPTALIQCKRLKTLDLSRNNFTGSLPLGFGANLVSLEKLDLSYNKFGGLIPSDLGNLSNLQGTVDLSHNLFNGTIPASLGNLPEKVYIDLTYNNLMGPIPQNGALMNRGPTAFIGNPGLCGPPLKNPCTPDSPGASPPSSYPYLPSNYPPQSTGNGKGAKGRLSKSVVIAIVVSDVIGICLIGLVFSYCYSRVCGCGNRKDESGYGFEKGVKKEGRKECLPGMISFTPLTWSDRLKIMKGTAKGLVYLHEYSPKKYVHGDLKPSNILLGQDMEPHISDFGLGRLANIAGGSPTLQSSRMTAEKPQQRQHGMPSEVLTANSAVNLGSYYLAPEALKAVKPSQKWDVYSYGVILLEMISGRSPLVQVGASEMDLVQWIHLCIEEKKPFSDVLDPYVAPDVDKEEEMIAVLKIAMACIHSSPERRPTMRHIYDTLERLGDSID